MPTLEKREKVSFPELVTVGLNEGSINPSPASLETTTKVLVSVSQFQSTRGYFLYVNVRCQQGRKGYVSFPVMFCGTGLNEGTIHPHRVQKLQLKLLVSVSLFQSTRGYFQTGVLTACKHGKLS